MMMEALEAGGLKAVYSKRRDEAMTTRWGEANYKPNDSYYELDAEDYTSGDLHIRYDGCLIKSLWGGVLRLPPSQYRVVFMRRPVEEIRVSLTAFFGSDSALPRPEVFDKLMDGVVEILRDRRSFISVDVLQYHDVLENPHKALASLNWPINVEAAALIPQIERARFINARA